VTYKVLYTVIPRLFLDCT